jgi:uncharacterized protein
MSARTDTFDLGRLRLSSGEGRRLELAVSLGRFHFGAQEYAVGPVLVPVVVDVSKMTGGGLALRLRFSAALAGPCMRCLGSAAPCFDVDVREVNQPGGGEELQSPYLDDADVLDLAAWARDAYVLALPQQLVCRADCAGLCPECGADLNADPDHAHERPPDPRWAALRELKLE